MATNQTTEKQQPPKKVDPAPDNIVLSFGVIADVQYASSEDGSDFKKTVVRRYRNSLHLLTVAVDEWKTQTEALGYPVQVLVQLGDLLDGRCQEQNGDRDECLHRILSQFNRIPVERYDLIGNHELYNFSRNELNDPTGPLQTARMDEILQKNSTFHSALVAPGIRLVVLDPYEISTLNGDKQPSTVKAFDYLAGKNPNNVTVKGVDWTAGLEGMNQRFVPYNGAISSQQLEWLSTTLQRALQNNERCFVLSHVSLQQGCCSVSCVIWNYEEVIECIHNPIGTGETPVVACLYGHAHKGGYVQDERGIHHVTLQSPLEAVGEEVAYATVDVYSNQFHLRGKGRVPSRRLDFPSISLVPSSW